MKEADIDFADMAGAGKLTGARAMVNTGYKPTLPALARGLELATRGLNPDAVNYCLSYGMTDDKGDQVYYQFYNDPLAYGPSGAWRFRGRSAWSALMASGGRPGEAPFDAVAKMFSKVDISINAELNVVINSRNRNSHAGNDGAHSLISELAGKGWLGLAQNIEDWSGSTFKAKSEDGDTGTPLGMALMTGHGAMACWLLSRGAKMGSSDMESAVDGYAATKTCVAGASQEPTESDRLACLRLAAHKEGLARVDARDWGQVESDPLAKKETLMIWLMVRGARAQAMGLEREARVGEAAKAKAKALDAPWGDSMETPRGEPGKLSVFGWLARAIGFKITKQEGAGQNASAEGGNDQGEGLSPSVKKSQGSPREAKRSKKALKEWIWMEAERLVDERSESAPDLAEVLKDIDKGDMERARAGLDGLSESKRLGACVALLGLAKAGFWDMPAPNLLGAGGVGDEGRHPMRWAGFKLAAASCGDGISKPIEGLSGLSLLGLSSALGFADACSVLVEAGAKKDPDGLMEEASPLSLAIRYGNKEIAAALLEAGASPLEGAKDGPFGFQSKMWALHRAFDKRNLDLVKMMLDKDPLCCKLRDLKGQDLYEAATARAARDQTDEAKRSFCEEVASLASRAGLRLASAPRESEDRGEPSRKTRSL